MSQILTSGAEKLNIHIDAETELKFEKYKAFLQEKNKVMNLTAITDSDGVDRLHFLDCLCVRELYSFDNASVIDIGSGAGFPGLPLKLVSENCRLTVLDALQKRVGFLVELGELLGEKGVACVHARAEEASLLKEYRDRYDFAVSRAVARLNMLTELCLPFVKVGGKFIAMKSTNSEEEIEEAKPAIKKLGGKIEKVTDYTVPGTDVTHRLVVIAKISETPKGYPRRFIKIQKAPITNN